MMTLLELRDEYKDFTFRLRGVYQGVVLLVGVDDAAIDGDTLIDLRFDSRHVANRGVLVTTKPAHGFLEDNPSLYDIAITTIPQPSLVTEIKKGKGDMTPISTVVYCYQPSL